MTQRVMQETWVPPLGREDSLEKGMATHSSIFAWRIPWTEEPGRLQSIGSDTTEQLTLSLFKHGLDDLQVPCRGPATTESRSCLRE